MNHQLPRPTLRCKFWALFLSRQDREEIVAVLENAKTRLWDGRGLPPHNQSRAICAALDRAGFPYVPGGPAYRACKRIRRILHRRLGFLTCTLHGWLIDRDRKDGQPIPPPYVNVQALRLQWIEELQKEYAP